MSYANRCSFKKTWESSDRDNDRGEPSVTSWYHHLMNGGSISVVHRLTGWGYGVWDTETGYRSPCGQFWLASGDVDIRDCLDEFDSEEGMIQWVIDRANTCTGGRPKGMRVGMTLERMQQRDNWQPKATEATP